MSVTFAQGFVASATTAGLKPSGKPDLALIVRRGVEGARPDPSRVGSAAVFTRNVVVGAPVIIGREQRTRILSGEQRPLAAVLINAGNSNSATGQQGIEDAHTCMNALAPLAGVSAGEVLPVSTGVIGRPLAVSKITGALPALVRGLARGEDADAAAAAAIMTTDLVPKRATVEVELFGARARIGGMAKGSGMIAPRLDSAFGPAVPSATMLAFLTTDAAADSLTLQHALDHAAPRTFDRISVDNHPSCSDTAVLLASGASGAPILRRGTAEFERFAGALTRVCTSLAEQIVTDGEGATRVFRVTVRGARTGADAEAMARQIVNSPLVKCAIHGRDPNWGRIVTAAGNAMIPFDTHEASLTIGPPAVEVYRAGVPIPAALDDPELRTAMASARVDIVLTVGRGSGEAWMMGCDLSKDYVSINADYTT